MVATLASSDTRLENPCSSDTKRWDKNILMVMARHSHQHLSVKLKIHVVGPGSSMG